MSAIHSQDTTSITARPGVKKYQETIARAAKDRPRGIGIRRGAILAWTGVVAARHTAQGQARVRQLLELQIETAFPCQGFLQCAGI